MRDHLSITALYTNGAWSWARLPGSELLQSTDADRVFGVTNAVLWLASWVMGGPSLRHGLIQRHLLIDHLTRDARHLVELAAGLSRRGCTRSASPEVTYLEVDLPHVVAHKRGLLERTDAGRAVLARTNFVQLGRDVVEEPITDRLQDDTTVIAEGLLMYLTAEQQRALFTSVAPAHQLVFDLVPPNEQPAPGIVGRCLAFLLRSFTGGRGFIADGRSRDDIVEDLLNAGFSTVDIHEPAHCDGFDCPFPDASTQIVVFQARKR